MSTRQKTRVSKEYKNAYGTWEVTTEGDCEGRTIKYLGIWTGYLDEIAFSLADQCEYSLRFTKSEQKQVKKTKAKDVNVSLNVDSNTWHMSDEELVAEMKNIFKNRNVDVNKCCYYASFTLSKK